MIEAEIDHVLTWEEEKVIKALRRLERHWPDSLWLFSANGSLCVMKKKFGHRVMDGEGVDQRWIICTISIENDGGDW